MSHRDKPQNDTPGYTPPAPGGGSTPASRRSSRLSRFFRRSREERIAFLAEQGRLSPEDCALLLAENPALPHDVADAMIENVLGVYPLPIGLGTNFLINGRDYVVPMVVEEPSIVAAVGLAAKIVRQAGGFEVECDPSMMIGQVQLIGCEDPEAAKAALLEHRNSLLELANELHPNLVKRGGGARDIEVRILRPPSTPGVHDRYTTMVVLHLLIDTCDAMGANLINTMAEGIAPQVEELTGGRVHLRILSNLADRRLVRARCRIPASLLAIENFSGDIVADGIVGASRFAEADPYRAATHNKGVMNGVDSVALATGNDWRAIEAGAHAYCCRNGRYEPMATWRLDEEGALCGFLEIPLQVGVVGGPIRLHPMLTIAYRLLGVDTAQELASIMGAVGLAQNMAALRALATDGIQLGHMSLHARSVAATAGAKGEAITRIARQLILEGNVKVARARELVAQENPANA